jgi:biotin synthase
VDCCSIINAKSGNCSEDCSFCAQSVHYNTEAETYGLITPDEILESAKKSLDMGVRRFCVVTSGRGIENDRELDAIAGVISSMRDMGIMPCATLGILDERQLGVLKEAGLNRYHHNIETARSFYPQICSTHDFDERVKTVLMAARLGMSVCSGGILGMGETMAQRAEMALTLRELDVDSVPLNFLMPVPGTPLGDAEPISPMEALKSIALFRFILPVKEIRVCGGRLSVLGELHSMMYLAGANGVLTGDYLTRLGRDPMMDGQLFDDLGLVIGYE